MLRRIGSQVMELEPDIPEPELRVEKLVGTLKPILTPEPSQESTETLIKKLRT